ncbi:hypothetical protein C8J57DRAFT_1212801 [Mycena rebaudengoi]|nr:hypothetical protein C8J57DRAFT_1212801 [Mycena rebaudengoi]
MAHSIDMDEAGLFTASRAAAAPLYTAVPHAPVLALRAAEDSESEDDEDNVPMPTLPKSKWKRKTLAELFGGVTKVFKERLTQAEIEAEAELMADLATAEAEADAEEDGRPDDGEIEINSDEEYKG